MELQIGDRLADETGEWEVIGRPYTTAGGKNAHVRTQRIGQPDVTELRTWGAHERITRNARPPRRATDDATYTKGLIARRVLPAHLGCDGPRRVHVGEALAVAIREAEIQQYGVAQFC